MNRLLAKNSIGEMEEVMIKKYACSQAAMPCGRVMSRRSRRVPFYVVVVDDCLLEPCVCCAGCASGWNRFLFSRRFVICVS